MRDEIIEIMKSNLRPCRDTRIELLEQIADEILSLLVNQPEFEHFSAGYKFGKSGKLPWDYGKQNESCCNW